MGSVDRGGGLRGEPGRHDNRLHQCAGHVLADEGWYDSRHVIDSARACKMARVREAAVREPECVLRQRHRSVCGDAGRIATAWARSLAHFSHVRRSQTFQHRLSNASAIRNPTIRPELRLRRARNLVTTSPGGRRIIDYLSQVAEIRTVECALFLPVEWLLPTTHRAAGAYRNRAHQGRLREQAGNETITDRIATKHGIAGPGGASPRRVTGERPRSASYAHRQSRRPLVPRPCGRCWKF